MSVFIPTRENCLAELADPDNPNALRVPEGEKPTATRVRKARAKGFRYERIAAAYGISPKAVRELEKAKGEAIWTGKGTKAHLA